MDVFRNGDRFYDFEEVLKKIREYEIATNTNFYRRDSRTIAAARKRGIKRNIKPELLFYSITFALLSDIKYPPKLSRKGRPKGSEKTVIGITKKSKRHHLQPFFKKSSGIKELAILQWILGDEKGKTVFENKEKVFQNEVQDLAFSSALVDESVDLLIVEKFFTKEAMIDVMSVVMRNKENSFHKCGSCTMDLTLTTNVVKCSSCLGWNHLPCVFLKTVPKAKHWYCKRCKQINK
ncbi:uncharacterized protein LOC134717680 [Mytilus trossulus]|uniref:uncharacterized protein LOC134717680 n=1 Tax=Mytilus trossulus TaxID=6551 RepID=UPI003006FF8B